MEEERMMFALISDSFRWLHHLYAWQFGYFWMPCPICSRMFGGHEVGGWPSLGVEFDALSGGQLRGKAVCSRSCGDIALRANIERQTAVRLLTQ
jgi:hypothetical protein